MGRGIPHLLRHEPAKVMGTAAFNIPNVGDTRYTDTEDSTLDYDLEGPSGGTGLGEDNELTCSGSCGTSSTRPPTPATNGESASGTQPSSPAQGVRPARSRLGMPRWRPVSRASPWPTSAASSPNMRWRRKSPRRPTTRRRWPVYPRPSPGARRAVAPPSATTVSSSSSTTPPLAPCSLQSAEQATTSFTPSAAQWTSIFGLPGAL